MASTLAGHISSFLFLFPIGLRRLYTVLSAHSRLPPPTFRSRPWYFSDHPNPHHRLLRNADLYALIISLPLAFFSDLFLFLTLVSPPAPRFTFAFHAAVLALFFFFLLLLISLRHSLDPHSILIPDEIVFLLAALLFLADYVLSFSDETVISIESRALKLGSLLTVACAMACFALAVRRSGSMAFDAGLSISMAMKGTWAMQMGFSLFVMPPRGCRRGSGGAGWGMECELEEDKVRGVELMDLLFAWHAAAMAALCVGMHWALGRRASRVGFEALTSMTRPIIAGSGEHELD